MIIANTRWHNAPDTNSCATIYQDNVTKTLLFKTKIPLHLFSKFFGNVYLKKTASVLLKV